MITRFYVDNYKTLQNFEIAFQPCTLLIGQNGTGKSSVLLALAAIREFAFGGRRIDDILSHQTLTAWDTRRKQIFEIDVRNEEGGTYTYRLNVEYFAGGGCRVLEESLIYSGMPLMRAALDEEGTYQAQLYRDDGSKGPTQLTDWTRSVVGSIQPRPFNQRLTWFREHLGRAKTVIIDPWGMQPSTDSDSAVLKDTASNFVSWYWHVHDEMPDATHKTLTDLREIIPGLEVIKLEKSGSSRSLSVVQRHGGRTLPPFSLHQLSEGQRALLVLYTLLHASIEKGELVAIDEPDNFLALREVQPWLLALNDAVETGNGQAILVSHHPEVLDRFASRFGVVFTREDGGPTRCKPWSATEAAQSPLPPSQLVATGEESRK